LSEAFLEVVDRMSPALRVAWYRFRTPFRRQWTSYLSVVLLIGSIGGVALASIAGARRTESSFPTYVASTNPSTVEVLSRYDDPALHITTGYDPRLAKEIAHLPLVRRSTTAVIFDGNINLNAVKGLHPHVLAGESPPTILGSLNGDFSSMDRSTLIRGHLADPSRLDEAVMNAQAASEMGLHVGSVIQIPFYTDARVQSANSSQQLGKPFLVIGVRMVGEVIPAGPIVESDIDTLGSAEVFFSQALTRVLAPKCATGTISSLQLIGGDRSVHRVLAEVNRIDPDAEKFGEEVTSSFVPAVQQAIEPEAIALAVFGGLAGLAVLLISAQMVGRVIRLKAEESDTLRALGACRSIMLADQLMGVLGAVLVGTLVAVAVASGLSPLAPLGPVRPVYPNLGVAFDWATLGFGSLAIIVILGSLAGLFALRATRQFTTRSMSQPWKRESRFVHWAANSGLPISAAVGVRFALEPGKGRNSTPVRSAIAGAVLAVAVLATTVTFGASLDSLVSHPSLYGWNWNYAIVSSFAGAEDLPSRQTAALLNEDRDVGAWAGVSVAEAKLDRVPVAMLAQRASASVGPPLLSGHGLDADNEIVLGPTTLAKLRKHVGDTVTFDNGITKPKKLLIVGIATMPSITDGVGMGMGALVSTNDFPPSLLNLQDAQIPGPNAILVRVRAGVKLPAARRSLEKVVKEINALPAASGLAGGVIADLRPVEIVNFRSIGTTPTVFAVCLAVGVIAALGITLGSSVRRRRRDLALLKALGFTQRQLASAITWQATVAAVIGTAVGEPLGVIIGRQLWIFFARSINAVPSPTSPIRSLVLIGAGALVFANVVAAIPGRVAAHTPTALVLRAE
jgi:hypothetical protein